MTINPEIIRILLSKKYDVSECVTYLLSVQFGLRPGFIPDRVKRQVNLTGLVRRDYHNGSIRWKFPLIVQEETSTDSGTLQWDWVNKYRQIFTSVKAGAGGDRKICFERMEQIFSENPVLTPDIVLRAAESYTYEFVVGDNNLKYLQQADNFIFRQYLDDDGKPVT